MQARLKNKFKRLLKDLRCQFLSGELRKRNELWVTKMKITFFFVCHTKMCNA